MLLKFSRLQSDYVGMLDFVIQEISYAFVRTFYITILLHAHLD